MCVYKCAFLSEFEGDRAHKDVLPIPHGCCLFTRSTRSHLILLSPFFF